MSGGYYTKTTAEVFVPSTGLSYSLPTLPDHRYRHTMDSSNEQTRKRERAKVSVNNGQVMLEIAANLKRLIIKKYIDLI